jgi:hypothetical protein
MRITALFLLLILFLFLYGQKAISIEQIKAITMTNENWKIDFSNLNSGAGKPSGSGTSVSFTTGQIAPGLYTGANFKVRAGFQYIYSIIPFRFSISNIDINFGTLTATNPVTRTNTLTISNGSAFGYNVTAYENHQLLSPANGNVIPDTTCDNGLCTQNTSALWTNTLTYGFGYRCDDVVSTDCSTDFTTSDYYKQFADQSANETPGVVMVGTNVGRNKEAQITYKVNISGTQPAGQYSNVIVYIATPTF